MRQEKRVTKPARRWENFAKTTRALDIRLCEVGPALASLLLPLALAACSGTTHVAPPFPPDYRNLIALNLLPDYINDAKGPPEISAEHLTTSGISAAGTSVEVRYFVNHVSPLYALFSGDRTVPRCIRISTNPARENGNLRVGRQVLD
ncbi:hypothetical protein VQH23_10635 [Pararoseomonas sp. SCSIO 73927]|uniref:hypothetical protein n=1 Tax=Pararoseomonas sp. SCSIO 73927 TaxID=3114537 RepID=UPI0030D11810